MTLIWKKRKQIKQQRMFQLGLRGGGRDSDANGSKMSRRTGRRREKPEMRSKNNRTRNGFVDLNFFPLQTG